jgi:hypothetical protein
MIWFYGFMANGLVSRTYHPSSYELKKPGFSRQIVDLDFLCRPRTCRRIDGHLSKSGNRRTISHREHETVRTRDDGRRIQERKLSGVDQLRGVRAQQRTAQRESWSLLICPDTNRSCQVDCIIVARPTRSRNLFLRMVCMIPWSTDPVTEESPPRSRSGKV